MQRYSHYRSKLAKSPLVRMFRQHFRHVDKRTLIKNAGLALIACFFFGAIALLAAYAWYSRDLPNPDTLLTRDIALSTKIYDRTGEHLLYEIATDKKRTLVTLDDIPDALEHAVIAAEDAAFYGHHGISVKGIARAVIFLGKRGGGSTITQQFVKNAILTNERRVTRKFKEIILSLAIERNFTKDEILQMYFNEIGYGGRNYGAESAAQEYYGKSVAELNLAQSATLAGLPQRPTTFLNNPELLKGRRDWILGRMVELGYISQDEATAAMAEEVGVVQTAPDSTAPHFVMWVKEQLVETYGEREVEEGGLKVITSLDYDKQVFANEAVSEGVAARGATYGFNNSGLVAIDPQTGQVLAMVGSVDYNNEEIDGQVNIALQPLQPGSSIKPIIYAAAFEKGYTPNTILWDIDTTFPTAGEPYSPKNYHLDENGPVTLRKALQGSLNVPAVKLLYLVGVDRALDFAERLGYSTLRDRTNFGLAIVLGGAEVKLLDHTNAYAAFAASGLRRDTTGIMKVTDATGKVLEEWKAEEHAGEQAVESDIAATLTNVLSDNDARGYVFGTGSYLQLGSRPVAAKTGTTNDFNDAWTVGYTPSLAAGVWVGNTDGAEMNRNADGSVVAAPIWNAFMQKALEGTTIEAFPAASITATGKAVLDGEIPSETVVIDTASGKLATERTPERFRKEVRCGEYHTILQYVDKDDPRGAEPGDPASDPYYSVWEAGIQTWLAKHNENPAEGETAYEICEIPTEEDDVHTERNQPKINLREPDNGQEVDRSFDVQYRLELRRDFARVDLSIDGSYIASSTNMSGAEITLPSWVDEGEHTLMATVFDDVDNHSSDEATIDVTEGSTDTRGPTITNPFNNQTIEKTGAVYTISIETPNASDATLLRIYATNLWTGVTSTIGETSAPAAIGSVSWELPSEAEYALTAEATYANGETVQSESVRVYVREQATASPVVSLLEVVTP